ncbi:hypothetical protein B0H13DRAFT_2355664 [Mycena leptocephala]|nr:hypothetical protein B0H13DRAFT_2355664 [Mycena leptocephala]
MKLSIVPLAVACTGLLASASPLRVIVVSSSVETIHSGPVAHLRPPHATQEADNSAITKQHAPCGARLRQKVSSMSNAFKIAFGFAVEPKNGKPAPTPLVEGKFPGGERLHILPMSAMPVAPHRGHHHGQGFHHKKQASFLMRVHFALMSLGPWEGRAVAFVLGCGIGVLLRMFFVMAVLSYRMIKGQRSPSEDEDEYTVIDIDAEEIFVAPPQYTYPVEKADAVQPIPVPVAPASN